MEEREGKFCEGRAKFAGIVDMQGSCYFHLDPDLHEEVGQDLWSAPTSV